MAAGQKITVLSAGAGGCTLAFHLTQAGFNVVLYQDENHTKSIQKLLKTKEIISHQEFDGYYSRIYGTVEVADVTTNIKVALRHSKILILMVPAFGQANIFRSALPYLTREHIFISMPGNYAIFEYVEELRRSNLKITNPVAYIRDVPIPCIFAECSIIPYACRKVKDNEIFVGGVKDFIHIGVFPQQKTENTLNKLNPIFQKLNIELEQKDILEVVYYNSNILLHPTIVVYNAGHIKHLNKGFRFYRDGVSPLTLKIIERMDKERQRIGKSLGFTLESFSSFYRRYYGDTSGKSLFNFFQEATFLHFVKAPTDLEGRFISEDLEYALIPIIEFLARKRGIDTSISDAIIESASCMVGTKLKAMRQIQDDVWNDIMKQKQIIG